MNKHLMNKEELITAYAKKLNITKVEAEKRVQDMLSFLGDIAEDDNIGGFRLVKYLTFTKEVRKERVGRNPRTKEEIIIPAKNYIKVKFGSEFDSKLNK